MLMATEKGSATPSARRSSDTIASEERAVAAVDIPEKTEKDHAVAADAESDGNSDEKAKDEKAKDEKAKDEGAKDGKEGKEGSLKDYFVSYSCTLYQYCTYLHQLAAHFHLRQHC
jgi:hypothetical protein